MSKQPPDIPEDIDELIDEDEHAQTMLCERLNMLVGGNALLSVIDDTIHRQLTPDMLEDSDWDLIAYSGMVDLEIYKTGDTAHILNVLFRALYGIAQYFYFCDEEIKDTWASDMHDFGLSDELNDMPDAEYSVCIARLASERGMNETEIFALFEFLYHDGFGVEQ